MGTANWLILSVLCMLRYLLIPIQPVTQHKSALYKTTASRTPGPLKRPPTCYGVREISTLAVQGTQTGPGASVGVLQAATTADSNMELDVAVQPPNDPALAVADRNPPWLTEYDHEEENVGEDDWIEASADSSTSDSMDIEEYATDTDSDAAWIATRGSQLLGGSDDEWDRPALTCGPSWVKNEGRYHSSDSRPATDAEQYDMEAAADLTTETESDPDTEKEPDSAAAPANLSGIEPLQSQAAAASCSCLAISFGNLSVNLQCPVCKPNGGATASQLIVNSGTNNSTNSGSTPAQGPQAAAVAATASTAVAAAAGVDRTHVEEADAAAIREIRHYQATVHSLVSEAAFTKLVKDVVESVSHGPGRVDNTFQFGISDRAVRALQTAAEDYLMRIFQKGNKVAIDNGRQKIKPCDIRAVATMVPR